MDNFTQKDFERMQRVHSRVMEYLTNNKHTIDEEYELVQAKKSNLSKSEREYLVLLKAYNEHEATTKEVEVQDNRPVEQVLEQPPQHKATATTKKSRKSEEKVVVE